MSLDTARLLRALALAGGTVALVLGAQRPALADRVTLKKDGRVLEGRVIDRGDFIYLEQEKGGINIPRGEILKVEFDDTGEVVRSAESVVRRSQDALKLLGEQRQVR